jgi:transporter family protein
MLIASGVVTGLSWLCYFRALATGAASKVAPVDKLSVVFVIMLSSLILGERLTPGKVFGGALIVAGRLHWHFRIKICSLRRTQAAA